MMSKLDKKILEIVHSQEVDCDEDGMVHTRFGNEFDLIALIKYVMLEIIEKENKVS